MTYQLSAATGVFVVSGSIATLAFNRRSSASAGTFLVSGSAVTFVRSIVGHVTILDDLEDEVAV